jgi:hypothetical protein
MTWEDWKWLHRWPRLTSIEWALEWLVYWCKGLAVFEVLEFAGRASVLIAVILWFWEADDRKKQSHYRAWELINSARGSTGDGGRRDALQDLNNDKVNLSAAPLDKAYLAEARLQKATLVGADLAEAYLLRADLVGANLTNADLTRAGLSRAILSGAKLFGAILSGANLTNTDLTGADLTGADLSGAILVATIFCRTVMPDGTVNNRDCPPEPALPTPSETPPAPN